MAPPTYAGLDLRVVISADQLEALAQRVASVLDEGRDDGFLDVDGAARYLATTPKAIYRLVERGRLPRYKPDGRLLFDPSELRRYVEGGR